MKSDFLLVGQILVAVALTAVILLQAKGSGLNSNWTQGQFLASKRGVEKVFFIATLVLAVLFLILAAVNAILA